MTALGFGADCIKIVVSMATDSPHILTIGKTKKEASEYNGPVVHVGEHIPMPSSISLYHTVSTALVTLRICDILGGFMHNASFSKYHNNVSKALVVVFHD